MTRHSGPGNGTIIGSGRRPNSRRSSSGSSVIERVLDQDDAHIRLLAEFPQPLPGLDSGLGLDGAEPREPVPGGDIGPTDRTHGSTHGAVTSPSTRVSLGRAKTDPPDQPADIEGFGAEPQGVAEQRGHRERRRARHVSHAGDERCEDRPFQPTGGVPDVREDWCQPGSLEPGRQASAGADRVSGVDGRLEQRKRNATPARQPVLVFVAALLFARQHQGRVGIVDVNHLLHMAIEHAAAAVMSRRGEGALGERAAQRSLDVEQVGLRASGVG